MVKLKITHRDGTVVEAEGEAAELAQLWLVPWSGYWYSSFPTAPVDVAACSPWHPAGEIKYSIIR